METLPANPYFNFPDDTLNVIRKSYNLNKPGEMDQAIDIFESWIKKQDHFLTKDFNTTLVNSNEALSSISKSFDGRLGRDYLERCIIRCKGSIERAKESLDNSCTARTMIPELFNDNIMVDPLPEFLFQGVLPNMTKDYYRVYFLVNNGQNFTSEMFMKFYHRTLQGLEYAATHDYCNGFLIVADYRNTNVMEMIKKVDMSFTAKFFHLILKSYGMRLKAIHLLSDSKAIAAFVAFMKQILSDKTSARIFVHPELETLYEHVEKDILPKDFGGNEKSCKELHEMWTDLVTSEEHVNHMKKMNAAKTNESLRMKDDSHTPDLGIPGTFRNITVD